MAEQEKEPSDSNGKHTDSTNEQRDLSAQQTSAKSEQRDQLVTYRLRLEEIADLVARIRHEINNPLTGVLGQAQLLLREDLSERARKRVETIEDLALRLRDIVAQLREVQRPGSERDTGAG